MKVQITVTRIFPKGKKGHSKSMTVEGFSFTNVFKQIKDGAEFAEKVKHTITEEPHYMLLLTWPEIQALIDETDKRPGSLSSHFKYGVDFNKLCAKMSAQLKWQALTVLKEYGSMGLEDPETADPTEPEPGFDEHCHCNRGIRTAPNDKKYCPKHGYEYTEDGQ